jgi:hypothetical protein
MRKLTAFMVMVLFYGTSKLAAQSTVSPDTVCANANNKIYKVAMNVGSTYHWTLKNSMGIINTPLSTRTDSIAINYGSVSGIDTLKLVEQGPSGCLGDTVTMAIFILPPVTASISGTDSICVNNMSLGKISISFTGIGPWDFTYTDGLNPVFINGIITSPYIINSPIYSTSGIRPYSIVKASGLKSCAANMSGSASITVFPKPNTSSISHY